MTGAERLDDEVQGELTLLRDEAVPNQLDQALLLPSKTTLLNLKHLLAIYDAEFQAFQECQLALHQWAGARRDGVQLAQILLTDFPPALEAGIVAQQRLLDLETSFGHDLEVQAHERQTVSSHLEQLQQVDQDRRRGFESRLRNLESLHQLAVKVIEAEDHLQQLRQRQEDQRGRKLANLWTTLSGQNAALQRDLNQASEAHGRAHDSFRHKALSLGLMPLPTPNEVSGLLERAHRDEVEQNVSLQDERERLRVRQGELNVLIQGTRERLEDARLDASRAWSEAQKLHGIPDWLDWLALVAQRDNVQKLWQANNTASERLDTALRNLRGNWSELPESLHDVESLRKFIPDAEAALVRQEQQQNAKHNEFLVLLDHRISSLKDAERRAALLEEQQARARQIESRRRRSKRDSLIGLLGQRHATLIQAEELARIESQRRMQEKQAQEGALKAQVRRNSAPVSPATPLSKTPTLTADQVAAARSMLLRHASAAAEAAMCLEALEEWAAPQRNALQLAALVSQPLPAHLVETFALWNRARQVATADRTDPAIQEEYERLELRWSTAWTELRRTHGLPADPGEGNRLWLTRAKAQRLWNMWEQAQERIHQQEILMTPFWAEWPLEQQNVNALRQIVGALETQAKPVSPVSPPARPVLTSAPRHGSFTIPVPVPKPSVPNANMASVQGSPLPSPLKPALPGQGQKAKQQVNQGPSPTRHKPAKGSGADVPLTSAVSGKVKVPHQEPSLSSAGSTVPAQPNEPQKSSTVKLPPPPIPQSSPAHATAMPPITIPSPLQVKARDVPPPNLQALPQIPGSAPLSATALPASDWPVSEPSRPIPLRPPVPVPLPTSPLGEPKQTEPARTPVVPVRLPSPALPGRGRAAPIPAHEEPLLPRRLTSRQRAEREAVRISEQYNWARGFVLLADALDRERWGQLRESIEREIALGMTPDEFELVLQLRSYWHDQIHYQSPYSSRYDSLPWALALRLIRQCAGVPCFDEMTLLIERFFDYAERRCSRRDYPAFSQRLGFILLEIDTNIDLDYWLCTREAQC